MGRSLKYRYGARFGERPVTDLPGQHIAVATSNLKRGRFSRVAGATGGVHSQVCGLDHEACGAMSERRAPLHQQTELHFLIDPAHQLRLMLAPSGGSIRTASKSLPLRRSKPICNASLNLSSTDGALR
jgi:hypothetical protein